jgi:AdoMet-dependent heme synthase
MDLIDRWYAIAVAERIPIAVHIDLTYRCVQHCVHCFIPEAWHRGEGSEPELSTSHFKSIIKQLAEKGTLFLCLSGGEIFLRPDLLELIRYARELTFAVFLLTSGIAGPTAEQAKLLGVLGLSGMAVSLYSMDPEVHDRITQTPGSWVKVMWTINLCQDHGIPLALSCTALKLNASGLPGLQTFCTARNLPLRLSADLRPRWDGKAFPPDLALLYTTFQSAGNGNEGSETFPGGERRKSCSAGLNICYITPGGEVWPCTEIPLPCGRVTGKSNFADIWEKSLVLNQFRQLMVTGWDAPGKICEVIQTCEVKDLGGFFK